MLGCLDVGDTNLIKWSVCDLVSQYFCSEGTKKAVYSYLGCQKNSETHCSNIYIAVLQSCSTIKSSYVVFLCGFTPNISVLCQSEHGDNNKKVFREP